jgi:energy-converting hydrogenase Eha subunit F
MKKVLALVMALMLLVAFTLVGCKKAEEPKAPMPAPAPEQKPADQAAPAPAPAEKPAEKPAEAPKK